MSSVETQILQCLILDGRVPFRRVAGLVGVSEQTVGRRYRAMRDAGHLRVVAGRSNFAGLRQAWSVRIRCRPNSADALAEALAERDDTSWIALSSGGSEILCTTSGPAGDAGDGVLRHLPQTNAVLSFSAQSILRPFATARDIWTIFDTPLHARLPAELGRARPGEDTTLVVADDEPLLAALDRDGRASVTAIASEIDWPVSRVSARLDALLGSGALYLLTDFVPEAFGYHASAVMQLTVAPKHIVGVCRALAVHRQTGFVAATTGSANVMAEVVCRTPDDLFGYVTDQVGELPGVTQLDLVPYLRRIKQASSVVIDGHLRGPSDPRAATRRRPSETKANQ